MFAEIGLQSEVLDQPKEVRTLVTNAMIPNPPMNTSEAKHADLKRYLSQFDRLAIAFSGGVDSTFLLQSAHTVLGNRIIAVTARSCSFPKRELDEASDFVRKKGIEHIIVDSEELEIEGFSKNPLNRCY
ncbi:MAG: 7-cyano-7-deazaguanine synthase, partial [Planctomycetaceae bacterium]|nr:7-cyano-7-deazaguanine synthase [Planctomycetaceae bacterium]